MKNKLVCLDSHIFSWVFRDKKPPEGDIENIRKYEQAKKLVKVLGKNGYILIIPRFVVSEVLCTLDEGKRGKLFQNLEKDAKLLFVDFGKKASLILAKILHQRYYVENHAYKALEVRTLSGDSYKMSKVMMKYDSMILACALDHEVDCLYTFDEGISKYPQELVKIKKPQDSIEDAFFSEEE